MSAARRLHRAGAEDVRTEGAGWAFEAEGRLRTGKEGEKKGCPMVEYYE